MTSGVGGAVFGSDNDRAFESKKDIEDSIIIAYAGRASEELFFGKGNITQGASNDISKATAMLYQYVAKYGFDSDFGLVDYDVLTSSGLVMERSITDRISAISNGLYQRTLDLMKDHKEEAEILAKKLIEVKTLDGNEVLALLGKDRKDYESC